MSGTPQPISMREAVGYDGLSCEGQTRIESGLVLKQGEWFLLTDASGNIAPPGHCGLGLFRGDTRLISSWNLRLAGGPPALLALQSPRSYRGQIDLAVNDAQFQGNPWDPRLSVHVRRDIVLGDGLWERVVLTSYLPQPFSFWVELEIGADFADIFEVRGWKRTRRGQFFAPVAEADRLAFAYRGLDGKELVCVVGFSGSKPQITGRVARWEFVLQPHEERTFAWDVRAEADAPVSSFGETVAALDASHRSWQARCTRWTSTPSGFCGLLARASDDLHALHLGLPGRDILAAGIPWYGAVFGRDAILTAFETLAHNPEIARETLRFLAEYQGRKVDPFTEEEPGKILHELRRGEMARNREIPHLPYYGTVDATPLWIILLHETWQWTGDSALTQDLLPHARRALEWILQYGDLDGDGFVEYRGSTDGKGLVNQGWKDSGDGVPWPNGSLADPPIALVEVQGYVYDAMVRLASLWEHFGDPGEARRLRVRAADLRMRIHEKFWRFAELSGWNEPV